MVHTIASTEKGLEMSARRFAPILDEQRSPEQHRVAKILMDGPRKGKRPATMAADETIVYDFCNELLNNKDVSDATYAAASAHFGETGLIELVGTVGYYSFVSMVLNTDRHPLPADAVPLKPL